MTNIVAHSPFFSIVIPTYNRCKKLIHALRCLQSQTFENYEVLVVDDGSTDDTESTVSEFIRSDHRVKYFFKENEERSIARNFGIARASGKYISFLDSDDLLYQNHLEVAYELLDKNNFPEVGHLGFELVDEDGRTLLVRNNFDFNFKDKLITENILHGNAIFIRHDVAHKVNFIQSRAAILSEDWYVWLRLAARYPFCFDNRVTSAVVHHANRSLMNIDPDKLIENTKVIVEHLQTDEFFLKAFQGKVSYHFANHYTFLTLILSLSRQRKMQTIRYLVKAITIDPWVIFRKRFLASVKHLILIPRAH
jgi:glycosyltransferase involved in cell wall biosynthesis